MISNKINKLKTTGFFCPCRSKVWLVYWILQCYLALLNCSENTDTRVVRCVICIVQQRDITLSLNSACIALFNTFPIKHGTLAPRSFKLAVILVEPVVNYFRKNGWGTDWEYWRNKNFKKLGHSMMPIFIELRDTNEPVRYPVRQSVGGEGNFWLTQSPSKMQENREIWPTCNCYRQG